MKDKIKQEILRELCEKRKETYIGNDPVLKAIGLAIQKTIEAVFEEIEEDIQDLNKAENYSLEGVKKACCQAELMRLKQELKKGWAKK